MDDDVVKSIGVAAGATALVPSFILLLENNRPYNHWQSEIGNLQGEISTLQTSETLVGNGPSVQPAIQHLDSQIVTKQKAIEGLDRHVPSHLSMNAGWGLLFGPEFVVGVAAWAIANRIRVGRYRERATYKSLAGELMATSPERPAPYGPLFKSTQEES